MSISLNIARILRLETHRGRILWYPPSNRNSKSNDYVCIACGLTESGSEFNISKKRRVFYYQIHGPSLKGKKIGIHAKCPQ